MTPAFAQLRQQLSLDLMTRLASLFAVDLKESAPLHEAAQWGHRDAAKELLKAKARLDGKNGVGETPLLLAARSGYADVVQVSLALEPGPGRCNQRPHYVQSLNCPSSSLRIPQIHDGCMHEPPPDWPSLPCCFQSRADEISNHVCCSCCLTMARRWIGPMLRASHRSSVLPSLVSSALLPNCSIL